MVLLDEKQIRPGLQQVPCYGPPGGAVAGVDNQLVPGKVVVSTASTAAAAVLAAAREHGAPEPILVQRGVLELKGAFFLLGHIVRTWVRRLTDPAHGTGKFSSHSGGAAVRMSLNGHPRDHLRHASLAPSQAAGRPLSAALAHDDDGVQKAHSVRAHGISAAAHTSSSVYESASHMCQTAA
jgi:hypothetical protein